MWCTTTTSACSLSVTLKRAAFNGISADRSKACRDISSMASRSCPTDQSPASMTSQPGSAPPAGITIWCGTPSGASNRVRRLSCRATTSVNAAANASASSSPSIRKAAVML
ncbi:Uncharacterised protein [Mycobacteroides abscessus subsp. abscessus]|nr:Uncharacterised protein [Mycobacteroides abscessus subsp. abscessus]